jgi:formamidopyrimidine-DNA glycosylase
MIIILDLDRDGKFLSFKTGTVGKFDRNKSGLASHLQLAGKGTFCTDFSMNFVHFRISQERPRIQNVLKPGSGSGTF